MLDSLSKKELRELFLTGKKQRNKLFTILYKNKPESSFKFNVVVSGKSKAHERNEIKRKIRNIIRENKKKTRKGNQLIIKVSKEILKYKYREINLIIMENLKIAGII